MSEASSTSVPIIEEEEEEKDSTLAMTSISNSSGTGEGGGGGAAARWVGLLGQRRFDQQCASFVPLGVKPTKLNLFANEEFVEKAAYCHAALDGIRRVRREARVFEVSGITDFCNAAIRQLLGQPSSVREAAAAGWDERDLFHIDKWLVAKRRMGDLPYDPRMSKRGDDEAVYQERLHREALDGVDWITILVKQELRTPGFVRVLCNALEMEDRVLANAQKRKQRLLFDDEDYNHHHHHKNKA